MYKHTTYSHLQVPNWTAGGVCSACGNAHTVPARDVCSACLMCAACSKKAMNPQGVPMCLPRWFKEECHPSMSLMKPTDTFPHILSDDQAHADGLLAAAADPSGELLASDFDAPFVLDGVRWDGGREMGSPASGQVAAQFVDMTANAKLKVNQRMSHPEYIL
jgi:hypothetical protein